jgi:hypothetical protein
VSTLKSTIPVGLTRGALVAKCQDLWHYAELIAPKRPVCESGFSGDAHYSGLAGLVHAGDAMVALARTLRGASELPALEAVELRELSEIESTSELRGMAREIRTAVEQIAFDLNFNARLGCDFSSLLP